MSPTKANGSETRTALDALRESGIVIAADGAEYYRIPEFSPTDATSNPSLVYAAVSKEGSEYRWLLEEAIRRAVDELAVDGEGSIEKITEKMMDWLLVLLGAEVLSRIPRRVSLSLDPRLFLPAFPPHSPQEDDRYHSILARCLSLHALAVKHLGSKPRILLKLPATPLGLRLAATLQSQHGIESNMTLIFGAVQARACAQAGIRVLSPFVGRVKDWFDANHGPAEVRDLADHPGIKLVREIKQMYKEEGYEGRTQIMAAGFRKPEEVLELVRTRREGGPDYVTLPPELLGGLKVLPYPSFSAPPSSSTSSSTVKADSPVYFTPTGPTPESLSLFLADLEKERIALDKVPEGLSKFGADTDKLEVLIRELISKEVSTLQHQYAQNEVERLIATKMKEDPAPAPAPTKQPPTVAQKTCTRGLRSVQVA
ncbi:unnamed protein product [Cyclocybe aegerita]|uniref:Transaldolase n=1 Tax=Cyclocybe aegerita TaxID=1973307 RepID=A0A8S0VYG8_CYCAE|nr:unnamed protein product [Cyclocybe aegerita]